MFALSGLVWPHLTSSGLVTAINMCSLVGLEWPCMALCCLVLPCVVLCSLVWPCAALYGLVRPCVALCDLVWPCVVLYSLFMALYGLLWQNIVFSRGHRSKFI